jgi:hypothetical protein
MCAQMIAAVFAQVVKGTGDVARGCGRGRGLVKGLLGGFSSARGVPKDEYGCRTVVGEGEGGCGRML